MPPKALLFREEWALNKLNRHCVGRSFSCYTPNAHPKYPARALCRARAGGVKNSTGTYRNLRSCPMRGNNSGEVPRTAAMAMATDYMLPNSALAQLWQSAEPFAQGGMSGMAAWLFVQPVDIVKVRIQLGDVKSPMTVASGILRNEGPLAFYRGLSAGLLRQATYTTARLGTFDCITKGLRACDGSPLPLWQKACAGLAAGAVGAVVGSPADLTLIRMQADTLLPEHQRRHYRGVADAFLRISREEGVLGLYRGVGPNIARAMALNCGMLASNDQAREMLETAGFDPTTSILGAATIAGFFAAGFSLPFDFVKTRMQEMPRNPDGTFPYRGFADCALQTARKEGIGRFYSGFPTYCARIAPSATLTLVFLSILRGSTGK